MRYTNPRSQSSLRVCVRVSSERVREPGSAGEHVVPTDGRRWRCDGMPVLIGHSVVQLCRQPVERLVHQLLRT